MQHLGSVYALVLALGVASSVSGAVQQPAAPRAWADWPARYAQRSPARNLRMGDSTPQSVRDALDWLARHQDEEGCWDADGFVAHDPEDGRCDGAGGAERDVEVTALALLAFLGDGDTVRSGSARRPVGRAVEWLIGRQDAASGRIGAPRAHAIATLALCELAALDGEPRVEGAAKLAINALLNARPEYGAWREKQGETSQCDVTYNAWALAALRAAQVARLVDEPEAWLGVRCWLDERTDPGTSLIDTGKAQARNERPGARDDVDDPDERRAFATAVAAALYLRLECGEEPRQSRLIKFHDWLVLRTVRASGALPLQALEPEGWCFASQAYAWLGGERWDEWRPLMWRAVIDAQRRDGAARGSWDPRGHGDAVAGVGGLGRVGYTALFTLTLEAHYRAVR